MKVLFMLVDDDPVVNFVSQHMVTNQGLTDDPRTFESGGTALDFINSHHSEYDQIIMLLDINMPEIDGWEVLDQLSNSSEELKSKLHVFMLSSSISDHDIAKSREYSIVRDYLIKPLNAEKCKKISSIPPLNTLPSA